ncbi:CIR protein PIR protein [Plasmodium vinckei lentum]|uniref:CIR protein PIR protein n=1 Tax=Plasmodium vinckei lentum TaxID=138297 RepID=A0A6V7SMV8_PLAVN|nr:CIR protein PIR protein [Plasmodium vinckei lentum]
MDEKTCKLFLEADKLFRGNQVDMTNINKRQSIKEYCPKDKSCKNNIQGINALGGYLFMELEAYSNNDHGAYFLMWLSDKLFKIHTKKSKKKNDKINLDEAYKKYLDKPNKRFDYWPLLHNIDGLKEANLEHMSEFYKLLKRICNTIVDYKNNGAGSKSLILNSTECSNQYMLLYENIFECKSYLRLLDNLKKLYNRFRYPAIVANKKKYPTLFNRLQTFTTSNGEDLTFAINYNNFDFSDPNCQLQYNDKILETSTEDSDDGAGTTDNEHKDTGSSSSGTGVIGSGTTGGSANVQGDQGTIGTQIGGTIDQGTPDIQVGDTGGGARSMNSGAGGGPGSGAIGGQVGTDSGTGSGKGGKKGESGSPGSGQGVVAGGPDSGNGGTDNGQVGSGTNQGDTCTGSDSRTKGKCDGQVPPNPASVDQNNASGSSDDGSKPSGDQDTTDSSGASYGYLPRNWGMSFNLMSYIPSVSDVYKTQKSILTNVTNQVNSAYNSAMAIAQDTYDKTVNIAKDAYGSVVSTVKNAYTKSTNYISGAVSSITNQFNPFGTSQLSDDQSGSGGSGNSLPTNNNPSSTTQIPKPDTNSPSLPSSPSPSSPLPLSPLPLSPLSSSSLPSTSLSTSQLQVTPQNIQATNLQPQSDPTQDSLKIPDQNGGSGSIQSRGTSYNTDPPSTGSGITTGTVVKMNEKSSIWCIGPNDKCGITGISIIVISISIILTIIYKYISFGSAKNSKKKKSMRRVINSIGGKRPVQIIIKSVDMKKMATPVINPIRGKKKSLLNIYKLMQADPVPFINLFFLLIFFVYKRKLNYLEL